MSPHPADSPPAHKLPVIGIVGGIGAGKSSVAREARRHRLLILDADVIGHEQLRDPHIQSAIRREFGNHIFNDRGEIDRPGLAALVFGETADHRNSLKRLEAILHPAIRREMRTRLSSADNNRFDAIVIDAPLLLEAGWNELCDVVIFIDTSEDIRHRRIAERGWTIEQLKRREAAQWNINRKKSVADYIIVNNTTLEAAANQFDSVVAELIP